MSNGAVPMGGVLVHHSVHEAMSQGPEATVELAHGYTYSGHPLACAAALATLDVYQEEGIFEQVARIAGVWEAAIHDIGSAGGVVRDIRNLGLLGAVEIEATPNAPGQRARAVALFRKRRVCSRPRRYFDPIAASCHQRGANWADRRRHQERNSNVVIAER
jgi:beta-alanine--pyruvate transaminase